MLGALGVVLALGLALVRRGGRVHALLLAGVPVAVLLPWVLRAGATSWPSLVAGVGLADWGGSAPQPWRVALLDAGGAGTPLVWTTAPLAAAGVLALARGWSWRGASAALGALVPLLLALALAAPRLRLGTVPAGVANAGEPVTPWVGTLLLPLVLVLVLALVHGLDAVRPGSLTGRARLGARGLLVTGVAAVLAGAAGVAAQGIGGLLEPWHDPRPAVAVDQAEGAFATRSLFVVPGERGAGYRFVGREDSVLVRSLPETREADAAVASDVTGLLAAVPGSEDLVAATAADLLAIRGEQVPEVVRRLDATDGLQRISPRGGWQTWRLSPTDSDSEALVASPRLRLVTADETSLVVATGAHGATDTRVDAPRGARLVVAEPRAWAEHAVVTADGRALRPVADAQSPTYDLPTGSVHLTVELPDPDLWWHRWQLFAVAVLAFLAVPFGRRETRVVGR
ncbi:hypothetical protein [Phycicoccus endophyticus]|uniref:hypothetical protein n=1 Tax=Phycicoccus endophyticus TaxID=1690220 RepID=UPI001CB6B9C8|nr:hypothetical protein [Phycicoccus endophyticus]